MGNASHIQHVSRAYGNPENLAHTPPLPAPIPPSESSDPSCRPFMDGGFAICHGTQLRGKFKGAYYYGCINDGELELRGRRYYSLWAAAHAITRKNIDHWLFWECRLPGDTQWQSLCGLKAGFDTTPSS